MRTTLLIAACILGITSCTTTNPEYCRIEDYEIQIQNIDTPIKGDPQQRALELTSQIIKDKDLSTNDKLYLCNYLHQNSNLWR